MRKHSWVTPEQVGFPGARLIARLRRRVRRHGKKSTETVYLISSLTLEQFNALGWIKLKRGYWVIESRLHHALDVSLDEERSPLFGVPALAGGASLVSGRVDAAIP